MSNILFCPNCSSVDLIKKGLITKTNTQRYQCRICKKYFCSTTNTIMYKKKLNRNTFRELVSLIINDTKIQTICDILHISTRTAYMWRMKTYQCAHQLTKTPYYRGKYGLMKHISC